MFILLVCGVGLAFIINLILTPFIIHVSHKRAWYDRHDYRKIHTYNTPRLGGVGIFISFILSIFILSYFFSHSRHTVEAFHILTTRRLFLFTGLLLVHVIGLVDDFHNIPALYKLGGQILAGSFVIIGGALINGIYIPLLQVGIELGAFSGMVTIFWLISLSNAVNLIDGMDGLAGNIGMFASLGIGIVHILMGNSVGALYSFILLGAIGAFLLFNRPKARVFMGDSGSLFLGFILGALAFIGEENMYVPRSYFQSGFIITITVLIIPIFDTVSAILRRLQRGKTIYVPDREHVHHKLMFLNMSVWAILGVVFLVNALMVGSLIVRTLLVLEEKILIGDIVLVSGWAIVGAMFIVLHYIHKSRREKKN